MTRLLAILFCCACWCRADVFTIVQMGDLHSRAYNASNEFQSTIDWILANTNDGVYNVKGVVSVGDVYEQNPTTEAMTNALPILTNAFQNLITNGVFVITAPGNHDADATSGSGGWAAIYAAQDGLRWTNIFPVSWYSNQTATVSGLGWVGSQAGNDSRQVALTYTNSVIKLLFATYSASFTNKGSGALGLPTDAEREAIFQPMSDWVSNHFAAYPDHNGIALAHYALSMQRTDAEIAEYPQWFAREYPVFSDYDGTSTNYAGLGPADLLVSQGLETLSNYCAVLSGHTRTLQTGHVVFRSPTGHDIDVSCLNMQTAAGAAQYHSANTVKLLTFNSGLQTILYRTFCTTNETVITNGQADFYYLTPGVTYREHTWSHPLAVPRSKQVFRLQ